MLQTKKPYNRKPKLNKGKKREQNPPHPYIQLKPIKKKPT
jgi:hypothetical protein